MVHGCQHDDDVQDIRPTYHWRSTAAESKERHVEHGNRRRRCSCTCRRRRRRTRKEVFPCVRDVEKSERRSLRGGDSGCEVDHVGDCKKHTMKRNDNNRFSRQLLRRLQVQVVKGVFLRVVVVVVINVQIFSAMQFRRTRRGMMLG